MVSSQPSGLPLAGSKRPEVRQISRNASWATSSAWAGSRTTRTASPKIREEVASYSWANAASSPFPQALSSATRSGPAAPSDEGTPPVTGPVRSTASVSRPDVVMTRGRYVAHTSGSEAPALLDGSSSRKSSGLLGRQGGGVGGADVDPALERLVVGHRGAGDPQPAVHLLAAHLHPTGARLLHELRAGGRVAAQHQPALAARGHRHVAADQEGQAAEHLLLRHGHPGQQPADPLRQLLVVGHVRHRGTSRRQRV